MALPPTDYDFVSKLRPYLIEMAEQDVADLLSAPNPSQTTGRFTALDYHEVGASVGPIVIQKGKAKGRESGKGGSKPLGRFTVRDHWRRQPYGPEGQDRELIWIQPYYKGSDLAATINKPYLVK